MISTQHLRSLCRELFLAGWNVVDIHRAIDSRPYGTTWPYSGAHNVRDVPGRLNNGASPPGVTTTLPMAPSPACPNQ